MDLIEEQIKAYERIISYMKREISRLERQRKSMTNVSRDCDGKIFSERCCMDKPSDRIHLPLVNKRGGS